MKLRDVFSQFIHFKVKLFELFPHNKSDPLATHVAECMDKVLNVVNESEIIVLDKEKTIHEMKEHMSQSIREFKLIEGINTT